MAAGPVLVVDFGAQYAQLIARRVREANVYSELVPHSMPVDEMLAKDPQAIILSGGPASVFEPGAPRVDKKLFEAGVPVLGICYGFQAMAYALGANVDKAAPWRIWQDRDLHRQVGRPARRLPRRSEHVDEPWRGRQDRAGGL